MILTRVWHNIYNKKDMATSTTTNGTAQKISWPLPLKIPQLFHRNSNSMASDQLAMFTLPSFMTSILQAFHHYSHVQNISGHTPIKRLDLSLPHPRLTPPPGLLRQQITRGCLWDLCKAKDQNPHLFLFSRNVSDQYNYKKNSFLTFDRHTIYIHFVYYT